MITAGVDVGFKYTKAVIVNDGKIIGKAIGRSGGAGRAANAQTIFDKALADAAIKSSDVVKIISTGKGQYNVPFSAVQFSDMVTAVKAASVLVPEATTVVDIGANAIRVATISEGKVTEFVFNEKCTAGIGLLLESMANRFELSLDELAGLEGPGRVSVNDSCIVVAELDALSLVNHGSDVREVCKALNEACAWRANSTLNDIYRRAENCVVLCGGLAKNKAFVKSLERISGIKFIIPEEAEYACAFGAASLAATY
jgi:predicted CoA-substrate-specific enzyme activase